MAIFVNLCQKNFGFAQLVFPNLQPAKEDAPTINLVLLTLFLLSSGMTLTTERGQIWPGQYKALKSCQNTTKYP